MGCNHVPRPLRSYLENPLTPPPSSDIMDNMERPLTHEDMMVRAIMDPTQQICRGCDQIITLSEPKPNIEYCLRCTEEIKALNQDYLYWEDRYLPLPPFTSF